MRKDTLAILFLGLLLSPARFCHALSTPAAPILQKTTLSRNRTSLSARWPTSQQNGHRSSTRLSAFSPMAPAWSDPGYMYMILLALQYGLQPVLTKMYAPNKIIRVTYLLAQDALRLIISCALLLSTGRWLDATAGWTLSGAAQAAAVPSVLYLVQNYCSLMAYQNLPPMTYNVLNQSKTLSAAVFCYFLLGQILSGLQVVSLFLLLLAAVAMEVKLPLGANPFRSNSYQRSPSRGQASNWASGVVPILIASSTSGLAGAIIQRSLQNQSRNSLLLTAEMAACSMFLLLFSLALKSPDRLRIDNEGWSTGWTLQTCIPLATNAVGGILVGVVTKQSGVVRKGFALIMGVFLSGLVQNYIGKERQVTPQQWMGGVLAAVSFWMHYSFPRTNPIE